MTQPNPKDPQAELDCSDLTHEQVERILKWHTNSQQELLRELLGELPSDTIVTSKYGYNSEEKKYGYRIGIAEAKSVIKRRLSKTNDGGS